MTLEEIHSNLCAYDKRNPDWNDLHGNDDDDDDEVREPRKGCFCDNCFYGRDVLAVELLKKLQ